MFGAKWVPVGPWPGRGAAAGPVAVLEDLFLRRTAPYSGGFLPAKHFNASIGLKTTVHKKAFAQARHLFLVRF